MVSPRIKPQVNVVVTPRARPSRKAERATFEPILHLQVSDYRLSARSLADLLRLLEILLCFRAMTPAGKMSQIWESRYSNFVHDGSSLLDTYFPSRALSRINSAEGAASNIFDQWLQNVFAGRPPLIVNDITRGSFDIALHAVNLIAVFGLQDYAMFKDTVQWATTVMQNFASKSYFRHPVESGQSSRLQLMPDLIAAVQEFDDVTLVEEIDGSIQRLRIRLKKTPRGTGNKEA